MPLVLGLVPTRETRTNVQVPSFGLDQPQLAVTTSRWQIFSLHVSLFIILHFEQMEQSFYKTFMHLSLTIMPLPNQGNLNRVVGKKWNENYVQVSK